MRKNRAVVAVVLIIATLIFAISGCSGNGAGNATTTPQTDTQANPSQSVEWPTRSIQIVVPYAAGGDTDAYARQLAKLLGSRLGVTAVVTNMEGSGGSIGSTYVKDAAPDGYTVFFGHLNMILNYLFGVTNWQYDELDMACSVVKDQYSSFDINAKNSHSWKTLDDVVSFAKQHPGEVKMGVQAGSFSYIVALAFQQKAGIELNMVDVGGSGTMAVALLGEQIDMMLGSLASSSKYYESGDFLSVGVTAEERHPEVPDIPTLKENGIDLVVDKCFGFYFPKGTPSEIIDIFNKAAEDAVMSDEFQSVCNETYRTIASFAPRDEALAIIADEAEFYSDLMKTIQK